jgi:hypothetical protein
MRKPQSRAVKLQAPHYGLGDGAQLHRYLNPDFMPSFQQDLARDALDSAAATAWLQKDRISAHDNTLVLRLPVHRTFYLVSCEAVWDCLGCPPVDPGCIASAGFVFRRVGGSVEQAWVLREGEPLGWQALSGEDTADPDLRRRPCDDGVPRRGAPAPAYSGEETHPLHVLAARDAEGRARTLLYGYVPLGGFHYLSTPTGQSPFDAKSQRQGESAAGELLPWPYGYRAPFSKVWRGEYSRPLHKGRPDKGLFELLRLLVQLHHLGEEGRDGNAGLEDWARGIGFYAVPADLEAPRADFDDRHRAQLARYRKYSLLDYLSACFGVSGEENPLVRWMAGQETAIAEAGGLKTAGELDRLPAKPAKQQDGGYAASTGDLTESLYMSAADAGKLRKRLAEGTTRLTSETAAEVPVPKFGQGAGDLYRILPFVRVKDESARERITWATGQQRSRRFRVAAPFDPDASRPSLIQMPTLGDLRRGLAKGASVVTPPDTFNLINALKLGKGASEDVVPEEVPSGGVDLQWICSFSLPVITLVAMILLMIMISLLNILFFWLPWVKICLPFPKLK